MYNISKKRILKLVLILTMIISSISNVFSTNIIFDSSNNSSEGPIVFPYDKMIVTGDSYAGLFCDYEDNKEFKLKGVAIAGRTIVDNKGIMQLAMSDKEYKLCLICIGVNDHFQNTPPYVFESTLRSILDTGLVNNKYVFISSYSKYPIADMYDNYPVVMYDNIIKKLCYEYPNTFYIDMIDYSNNAYISNDNIHYSREFYDIMYNNIVSVLRTIAF